MCEPIAQSVALAYHPTLCLTGIEVGVACGDVETEAALEGDGELVRLEALAGGQDVEPVAAVVCAA